MSDSSVARTYDLVWPSSIYACKQIELCHSTSFGSSYRTINKTQVSRGQNIDFLFFKVLENFIHESCRAR